MSYRSVIRFQVKPGMEAAFEANFLKAGMLERPAAIPGFVSAELVRGVATPAEYFVIGAWESERAYADWQAVSHVDGDAAAIEAMRATLIDPAPGRLFRPVARSK